MIDDQQIGPGMYVKFGIDFSQMVSAGGAAAIVLNQTLQLFQQFESAGQNAYNKTVGAAINYADQLKKVSDITSISTDDLQRLRAAGLATGVSFDSIATAARMMTQKIGDAGAAGDELRASLAKIGVQVYDTNGKFKDTNDIFWETLKGLNGMSDAQERNRLALQTLGRSWYELAPMIRDYDIAAAAAAAKDPIDQAKIDRAHDFGVKLEIINAKFTAINRTVGDDTIPILDSFLGVLERATSKTNPVADGLENIRKKMLGLNELGFAALWGDQTLGRTALNDIMGTNVVPNSAFDPSKVNGQKALISLTQIGDTEKLTDKYAGLSDAQIEVIKTTDLLTQAEKDRSKATNQTDYDKYSAQIQGYKNKIDELNASINKVTESTKAAAATQSTAWASTSIVGTAGSQMQLFMQKEMEAGADYQTALNNWAAGTPTNKSTEGTLASVGKSSAKKTVTPGSAEETNALSTQYTTQESQATKHYSAMQKMIADYNTALVTLYITQETADMTHWTAVTEMMKISLTNMSESWREYVTFAGQFPTIHNIGIVTWDKNGPDWTPESNPVFMQTARLASLASQDLAYKSADFSSVKLSSTDNKTTVGKIEVNVTVTGTGTESDVKKAATNGVKEALASPSALGGGN